MADKRQIGRLAMRHEGDFWNAYYAMPDTMDGALHLGSLHMGIATRPEFKARFMAMMQEAVAVIIREKTGAQVDWPESPHRAPEHERSGHG